MDRPIVVRQEELRGEPTPTPGVTRFEAFRDERVWVGRVENGAHQASDWHVHPGHDTYGHVTQGRFFVEFGPGGSERVEMEPGDFVLIPKGVVHREGNAGAEPNDGVIIRVGEGPVTVNLDGPEIGLTLDYRLDPVALSAQSPTAMGTRFGVQRSGMRGLPPDVALLFGTRALRLFSYGFLAVVLVLYLNALGLSGAEIGLLLALTLVGDAVISLWLTTHADRIGRRRVLVAGALLVLIAGLVFAATPVYAVLVVAATIGVISPTGNEVGPFLAVEQASLSQLLPSSRRTGIFAWYQLVGSLATAAGALAAGAIAQVATGAGASDLDAYRLVIIGYAVGGAALALLFLRASPQIEVAGPAPTDVTVRARLGLHRSGRVVARLSALFALDAFAGGFVAQSFIAYWFSVEFGLDPAILGLLLAGANILAGISALAAAPLAARFGLVRTMVFTHLPSNVLLILVPFMPNLALAAGVLLARFAISQMDVPTRQSYTMAIVSPDERSAAAGVTGIARSLGVSASPLLAGPLYLTAALAWTPFVISGALKIVYDVALYRAFVSIAPGEE